MEDSYVALSAGSKALRKRILGVFTYEPAFPSAQADFFTPFLLGIEEEAQQQNYDLLLLTSAGVGNNRKIFSEGNRLRIADGCLVLGREFDRKELARLVAEDYPFVAIGRREDAGGPVPYVGGDYAAGTRALVDKAGLLGHSKLAYIGPEGPAESIADRWLGFNAALTTGAQRWPISAPSIALLTKFWMSYCRLELRLPSSLNWPTQCVLKFWHASVE